MRTLNHSAALMVFIAISLLAGYAIASPPTGDISAAELEQQLTANTAPLILDVRSVDEYDAGHLPTATNIPHTEIADRLTELPADHDAEIIIYCRSGRRAAMAKETLENAGFSNIRHLDGDYIVWKEAGLPLQMGSE